LRGLGDIDKAGAMRATPVGTPPAARAGRRRRAAATAVAVTLLGAAGCGSLAEAQQVIGRADLVNELSARLSAAEQLTYSADYRLSGGRSASIARSQNPARAAYTYPGGKLIVTADATTECRGTACRRTPPPSPSANPTASLFTDPGAQGLVPPTVVVGLLTAAALDADAVIDQEDTTVAGQHATCVDVRAVENAAASSFNACITTAGVLGSFTGVVDGSPVELALTRYSDTVAADAFDLPKGARVS
jgi:hypothetical protein